MVLFSISWPLLHPNMAQPSVFGEARIGAQLARNQIKGKKLVEEDRAFSRRLQKMAEFRNAKLSAILQRDAKFQLEVDEHRLREQEQKEYQRRWEEEQKQSLEQTQSRFLEEQRRKAQADARDQEQLRLLEQKEKEEHEQAKREQERSEQERLDREEKKRQEQEDHERKLRLAEVESERRQREDQDPKFRDAMAKRRARQERNRLRQEARQGAGILPPQDEIDEPLGPTTMAALPESLHPNEELGRKEQARQRIGEDECLRDLEQPTLDSARPILAELLAGCPQKDTADIQGISPMNMQPPEEPKRPGVFAIPKRRAC